MMGGHCAVRRPAQKRKGKKNPQPAVAFAREAERQQCRTDSVKYAGGDFRRYMQQRQSGQCGGQGILFERRIVGILVGHESPRQVKRPVEVAGTLVDTLEQEPAKCTGGDAHHRCH